MTNNTCAECGEPATCAYKSTFETIPLCLECFEYLDNYDGPPDRSPEEQPPTVREQYEKAWRMKYYGEGL